MPVVQTVRLLPVISKYDPGKKTCELTNDHLYEGMVSVPRPLQRHPRDFAGLISQQNSTDALTQLVINQATAVSLLQDNIKI